VFAIVAPAKEPSHIRWTFDRKTDADKAGPATTTIKNESQGHDPPTGTHFPQDRAYTMPQRFAALKREVSTQPEPLNDAPGSSAEERAPPTAR
jgi:hypothetical protein